MNNRQKFLKALYDLKAFDLNSAVNLTLIAEHSGVGKNAWADSTHLSAEELIDCHFKTDSSSARNLKVCWITQHGLDVLKSLKVPMEDVVDDLIMEDDHTLHQQSQGSPNCNNVDSLNDSHELLNIRRMLVNSNISGINLSDPLDLQVGMLITKHLELLAKPPTIQNFDTYRIIKEDVDIYTCFSFEEAVSIANKVATENNCKVTVKGSTTLALIEPIVTVTTKVTYL